MFNYPVLDWKVYDGDTVRVLLDLGFYMRHRVSARITDVDTPEIRGSSKWEAEYRGLHKNAGQVVTAVVSAWCKRAEETEHGLWFSSTERDKYSGRAIGDLYYSRQEQPLSRYLLDQGLALPYSGKGPKPAWTITQLARVIAAAKEALQQFPE